MKKNSLKKFLIITKIFLLALTVVSCSSTKKIKYFQDIPDSGKLTQLQNSLYKAPKIQVDDILTIAFQSLDANTSLLLNSGNITTTGVGVVAGTQASPSQFVSGYLVDKDGFIELAILGKVKVAGLTTFEAKSVILDKVNEQYKNVSVTVRYANFKFSVIGEVNRPATYVVPNERVTFLDALAMAGDITIFGKRENVLLIRMNEDGTKTPYRIDMTKSDILSSPFYYLRQNDFIYVEPTKAKAAATDAAQTRNYAIIGSILSIVIVFLTRR